MSFFNKFKGTDSKKSASSYWFDEHDSSYDYLDLYSDMSGDELASYKKTNDLYKLSATRRAIANFVQIVTQKNIPVSFATKSNSCTDGEKVILSADVDNNFDVSVGLALHEGSHIVLSDFGLLTEMNNAYDSYRYAKMDIERSGGGDIVSKIQYTIDNSKFKDGLREMYYPTGKIGSKVSVDMEIKNLIGSLTNWIEDRRIDRYIYNSAPGYRDYYTSMYDFYFNDKAITKGIASDEYTDENIESYMFRIINLHNEKTDLSKLKGLRAIYRLIDLKNIDRLKSTEDVFNLSIDVTAIILDNIAYSASNSKSGDKGEAEKGDGNPTGEADGNGESTDGEGGEGEGIEMATDGDFEGTDSDGDSDGDASSASDIKKGKETLPASAKRQLDKKIQKQKDFLDGKIKKKQITKGEAEKLQNIVDSDTQVVRVGNDYETKYSITKGVDCIVVKNLTENLLEQEDFPFSRIDWKTKKPSEWAIDDVTKGVTLGNILGKKLQVRNESRETVYSRLTKGKIDGRMVASLGYNNENVFYNKDVDQYKKANLHISIDYSGSMHGDKLRKAITSTVAIVKACQMARNINVQVSIRSTDSSYRALPYIAVVYDSTKNTFRQFCKYMSILQANNTTPEGLCFEAIQKQLIPTTNDTDSFFLNFSDGQPCYSIGTADDSINYQGEAAAEHTKKQINKMRNAGINTLSYFISDYSEERIQSTPDWRIFQKCYGKDAKSVNVENMMQVAKTMNELFLQK
jgi:hypothetical protein